MKKYLFPFLFFSLSLFADPFLLDDVMPQQIQVKTGVSQLTPMQKEALESWLNQTFVLKTQPTKPASTLSISINIDNGQKLQLSDNSIWQVAPSDVAKAALWITPAAIEIQKSNDPRYPSVLKNTLSGETIRAKKISP